MHDMQAARGASLSDADTGPESDVSRRGGRPWLVFGAVSLGLLAIDQATKAWAVASLVPEEPRELVGSMVQLTLIRNPGAAFSTGTGHTWIFTTLSIAASVAVVWVMRRTRGTAWSVAFGVLLAGIVGNLIDRLVRPPGFYRGHVVDFVQLPHWPIFNVADMCINVAAVLIVVLSFLGVRLDGSRSSGDTEDAQ
ncbi:MAG: signal peptidase II [Nocardioides sp.]|nr:signal peptidase II [Nocardioides sp.]